MKIFLLIISLLLFYTAFELKDLNDNTPVWKKSFSYEQFSWILSIIFFILFICSTIIKYNDPMSLFYLGYFFLAIHMIGQWFFNNRELKYKENTLRQYFIDNILGNLIYKSDSTKKEPKKSIFDDIIINRNLSIFFFTLFIISCHYELPVFGKLEFK